MTPAPEKATPIPALLPCPFCGSSSDELMLFCDSDEASDNSGPSRRIQCAGCNVEAPFYPTKAEAIAAWNTRADREARPSLPDSREERIREDEPLPERLQKSYEKGAQDERDRLFEKADRHAMGMPSPQRHIAMDAKKWLGSECGAMLPADRARARQGGNNG